MRLSALTYAVVTVATAAVLVYPGAGGHAAEKQAAPIAPAASAAPDADKLPDDAWGRAVRHGRDLMTRTYALIGPEVGDPYLRYAGNNLACTNCHLDSGTSPFGLPLRGVAAAYPGFNQRSGRVITLQERVNQCMTRSMAGRALPPDSPAMVAFLSYLRFISDGVPVGKAVARAAPLPAPPSPPNAANGARVFKETCAACHGEQGQGIRNGTVGDAKGYQFPPLWGPDSFNRHAGMGRVAIASSFIHGNMPAGTTPDQPVLSVQAAWDVAAYIDAQDRP